MEPEEENLGTFDNTFDFTFDVIEPEPPATTSSTGSFSHLTRILRNGQRSERNGAFAPVEKMRWQEYRLRK